MVVMLNWWFNSGLKNLIKSLKVSLYRTIDTFSLGLLFKTLFSPFRQISAGMLPPGAPIKVQISAAGDRLFSRLIGFFIRSLLIIVGSIVILFQSFAGILIILMWLVLPLFPLIGLAIFLGVSIW